jgi:predicted trehalose synthase
MLIVPLLVASLAGAPPTPSVRERDPIVALEARMHPIHTSFVDVSNDPSTGTTRVTVRVFADDFAQAVSKASGTALGHAANVPAPLAARYVASSLQLMTVGGQAVALQWRGIRRTGDVV